MLPADLEQIERSLFSLSHVATESPTDSGEIEELASTIKAVRAFCVTKESQTLVRDMNIHLLIEGYLVFFSGRNQDLSLEALKFFANFVNENTPNQGEVLDRWHVHGNLLISLLQLNNGTEFFEALLVFLLNCTRDKSSFIGSSNFHAFLVTFVARFYNLQESEETLFYLVCRFCSGLAQCENFSLSLGDISDAVPDGEAVFVEWILRSEMKYPFLGDFILDLIDKKGHQRANASVLLQALSSNCVDLSNMPMDGLIVRLHEIFLETFSPNYDPALQHQSMCLLSFSNCIGAFPCRVSEILVARDVLPLIVLCTSTSEKDSIRRESAVFCIKLLSDPRLNANYSRCTQVLASTAASQEIFFKVSTPATE